MSDSWETEGVVTKIEEASWSGKVIFWLRSYPEQPDTDLEDYEVRESFSESFRETIKVGDRIEFTYTVSRGASNIKALDMQPRSLLERIEALEQKLVEAQDENARLRKIQNEALADLIQRFGMLEIMVSA